MADGLEALENKNRRRSSRAARIPPSLHKPRETPVALSETPELIEAAQDVPVVSSTPLRRVQKSAEVIEPVTRRSIHLSAADDAYLHAVFMAGMQDPAGKFDASHSAVVRLALARLSAEMTPVEVVAELRSRAPKQTIGRPRR